MEDAGKKSTDGLLESIQAGSVQGHGAVAVLLRDTSAEALSRLTGPLFSALAHFGIPYRVEPATSDWMGSAAAEDTLKCAALLLPQGGTAALFPQTFADRVTEAVSSGLGIVCYESDDAQLPGWLRRLPGTGNPVTAHGTGEFTSLITCDTDHYITWTRNRGETVTSDRPLSCMLLSAESAEETEPLLVNEHGDSLLLTACRGEGRVALFPFAISLYAMDCLGHACGADDIFTRSIVWAARKPFLTAGMPMQAGLVIDDCSGSYNHFGYVDIMNRYGWKPYTALFTETIDEVAHEDTAAATRRLKRGWDDGTLEIGFHALRYNDSFCFSHLEQRPLREDELQDRFLQWDRYEKRWEIRHSSWAHPHFGEISSTALPYYQERGIEFLTYLLPLDAAWFEVPEQKDPLPPLPPFGHPGYLFTEVSECPGITVCNCVLDHKSRESSDYIVQTDYLWNHTCFWDEADTPQPLIGQAAATLAAQLRRGLDSGFYGEGATHEQRIACLRPGELEELFQETEHLMQRYDLDKVLLSKAMESMRQHQRSKLVSVNSLNSGGGLSYRFASDAAVGMQVQLYRDGDELEHGIETECIVLTSSRGELS